MNNNETMSTDVLLIICIAPFLIPFAAISTTTRAWLLNHHILVPANDAILAIHTWNIGLDWPRLILTIGILALASTGTISTLRYRHTAKNRRR